MKTRRRAREAALQALYQCDALSDWSAPTIALFFVQFYPPEDRELSEGEQENLKFSERLIEDVRTNLEIIDKHITKASTHWSLNRMSRVDRNILRFSVSQLLYCTDIPSNVVINEAIEVAKRFSNDDSSMFVNGVLDQIARTIGKHTPAETISEEPLPKKQALG